MISIDPLARFHVHLSPLEKKKEFPWQLIKSFPGLGESSTYRFRIWFSGGNMVKFVTGNQSEIDKFRFTCSRWQRQALLKMSCSLENIKYSTESPAEHRNIPLSSCISLISYATQVLPTLTMYCSQLGGHPLASKYFRRRLQSGTEVQPVLFIRGRSLVLEQQSSRFFPSSTINRTPFVERNKNWDESHALTKKDPCSLFHVHVTHVMMDWS